MKRLAQPGTYWCVAVVLMIGVRAAAQEPEAEQQIHVPTIKFFYFDAADLEWAVSAEADRLDDHLAEHAESRQFYDAVRAAVVEPPQPDRSAEQMTRWIETQRERFDETRRDAPSARMAEGIVAYLRAHDFNIHNLVGALRRRSGASDVELAVVHLRDPRGEPAYRLKVVLVEPDVELGKQGFNVNLAAPNASYTVVVYALGLALYELQEIINRDASDEPPPERGQIEALPVPEPMDE